MRMVYELPRVEKCAFCGSEIESIYTEESPPNDYHYYCSNSGCGAMWTTKLDLWASSIQERLDALEEEIRHKLTSDKYG